MAPCEVALCAGPLVTDWHGDGGGGHVAMTVRRRRSLGGADGVAGLGTFGELSRRAIERYERLLGVRCAFPKYDIVAVPDLAALAESMPGLMLVNESLLARMIGRDLAGWADQWLRTEGASVLRPELTAAPDGTIGSLAVTQDRPRTQLIGIGLYDLDGTRLRRRQVVHAEVGGERTPVRRWPARSFPTRLCSTTGTSATPASGSTSGRCAPWRRPRWTSATR